MIKSVNHLAFLLNSSKKEIDYICKHIDRFYYEKYVEKYLRNGELKRNKEGTPRYRVLNPSIGELKVMQKRVNSVLTKSVPLPSYICGATKGKDNVQNAVLHKGHKYVFQTDLQDFFPFVTSQQVYDMLIHFQFSADVARIITRLTTYKGHVPQGAPTSAGIANLVFVYLLGSELEDFAQENNLTFTTFVDDVTISSSQDFKDKIPFILNLLREKGFKISHAKTHYRTNHPEITGVKLNNNTVDVTDAFWEKHQDVTGKTPEQVRGEENYLKKVKSYNR